MLMMLIGNYTWAQDHSKHIKVDGKGQTIVLLHGGTFDAEAFAKHAEILSEDFQVIRPTQYNVQYGDAGMELSEKYSVQTESNGLKITLDSMGITEPVVLVGHSYGGVIAFDFAINYPDRIKSLVLIEAPLFDLAKQKGVFSEKMKEIVDLSLHFTPQASITEEMIKSFRCEMVNCESFDITTHRMWSKWLHDKDRLRGLYAVPLYKVDLAKLRAFQQPVLIVTGTNTIEPNKTIDQILSVEFPDAHTGQLSGEHTAIYQQAPSFIELLHAFMRKK